MRTRTPIMMVAALITMFAVGSAPAQELQWLQYHSAREARRIVGDMSMHGLELSEVKPVGVELPEFECDEPLFAEWPTPMVKAGQLWIALDRSSKHGPYNKVFIDSNADGNLKDETAVEAYRTEEHWGYIGPIKVVFEGEDGPITYHLSFETYNYDENNRRLYVYPGCWYEGTVQVGSAKKQCVLIDYNVNGTFNNKDDESLDFNCDRIRIGEKDSRDTRFVGNYIEVDEVLYQLEIAQDGAYVKLAPAKDLKFGNIQVPETITDFAAGGENGLLAVKLEKGVGKLPVGKYRIHHWAVERKDEKGDNWKMEGRYFRGKSGIFEIAEDTQAKLDIGEPIVSTLDARKQGDR
ncbi:MAG: hypothetical protein ACYS9Y_14190, partial [Planctomycetota bacterium]